MIWLWKIYEDCYYDYVGALPNGGQRQANLYALTPGPMITQKASFKGLSRFIAVMIDKAIENEHDLASVFRSTKRCRPAHDRP